MSHHAALPAAFPSSADFPVLSVCSSDTVVAVGSVRKHVFEVMNEHNQQKLGHIKYRKRTIGNMFEEINLAH